MTLCRIVIALLAVSGAAQQEKTPVQVVRSFIAAYGRKDFRTAAKFVTGANPRADFSGLKKLKSWPKFTLRAPVASKVRGVMTVACTLQVADPGEKPLDFQDRVMLQLVGKTWKIVPLKPTDNSHDMHIINSFANLVAHPETFGKPNSD